MAIQPENPEVNFVPLTDVSSFPASEATAEKPGANTPAVKQETSNIVPSGNGSVMSGGALQSPNYSKGNSGWKIDSDGNIEANDGNFRGDITGASGTFSGTVTVNSIDIGGDDATSAHIDSDGNFWTGASVANKLTAPVRINKDGTAYFTGVTTLGSEADGFNQIAWDSSNLQVNGSYVKNQDIFGDGSDGDVTISADTSLSSDMFYNNLTINTTKTLNPNGYRVFVKGTLTINGTGAIARNGNNGTNGTNAVSTTKGSKGTGGAALADGSIKGALAGKDGVDGVNGVTAAGGSANGGAGVSGVVGSNQAKSMATADAVAGANGGNGGTVVAVSSGGTGGTGGAGGTRTGTIYNKIHNSVAAYRLYDDLDVGPFTSAPSSGSGASGGTGGVTTNGGSPDTGVSGGTGGVGGGGGSGGIVCIFARKIVNAGTISALGGNGGNAGTTAASSGTCNHGGAHNSAAGGSGGSAGGSGGSGGIIIIVYSALTNTGTISAAGGSGGTRGTGQAGFVLNGGGGPPTVTAGADGGVGATGTAGVIIYLQV